MGGGGKKGICFMAFSGVRDDPSKRCYRTPVVVHKEYKVTDLMLKAQPSTKVIITLKQ